MHDDPTEHTCPHGSRPIDERCDTCWREENDDPIDFAMLDLPAHPGPCKAATTPEMDPLERRLEREREAAEHIIAAVEAKTQRGPDTIVDGQPVDYKFARALEVKHGSGKVKATSRRSRSKAAAIPPAPPPTPEQQAAHEASKREAERLVAEVEDMTAAIAEAANRLAPEYGGRVTRLAHTSGGATLVMFGDAGPHASLCMSGPGFAECEIEVDWMAATPGPNREPIRIRTRFQSYATSGNTTPEQAEAQGLALVAAARFARAVVAAVSGERPTCGGTRELTDQQKQEVESVRMAFSTIRWLSTEEIARADEWHARRPQVFAVGWLSDLNAIAEHLVGQGHLRKRGTCPVLYQRVARGRS